MSKRRKFSKAEREAVYAKYDGHCAYCGSKIPISKMQVDHMISLEFYEAYTHGTPKQGTNANDIGNLMPACRSCNNYKHSMLLERFREAAGRWCEVLTRDNVTYRNAVRFGQVKPTPHPVEFFFEKADRLRAGKDGRDV